MSTVQEISGSDQAASGSGPHVPVQWIHQSEEAEGISDADNLLREDAEKGEQELDAGHGATLEEAREMTSHWTAR